MHCRNCGKEVNEKAVACLSCGLPPMAETKFCQECGTETNDKQIVCIKCGCSLGQGSTTKNVSAAKSGTEYEGIYCSSDDKVLTGLLGGLGHKFNVAPIIFRILIFIIPFWPVTFAAYFILGLTQPKYPTKEK